MKKFKKAAGRQPQADSRPPAGRVVVGLHAVNELLRVRPGSVREVWVRANPQDNADLAKLLNQARSRSLRVTVQPPSALDRVAGHNQGVIAFAGEAPEADWAAIKRAPRAVVLALDEVEDPQNVGAILRSCWLFGVSAVLTTVRRSAQGAPAVSKAAQGAMEHVPLVVENSLPEALKALKDDGFWIFGLAPGEGQVLYDLDLPEKLVWVLGSEGAGIRKSTRGACDGLVTIPQADPSASFNVSAAAAVALSETCRQFRAAAGRD